ncbi:MAG: SCO family protein [Deltaproteobacteria bacterium]|nr:SCO family protein [Deltaproteobacteria bacterium]
MLTQVAVVVFLLSGIAQGADQAPVDGHEPGDDAVILKTHLHADASGNDPTGTEPEVPVGVDEKLGAFIDLNLAFQDENGRVLRLGDFIEKPTLILPVYYYCPGACSTMLANLASAVNKVPLSPGEAYQVLAVSFDADETPALAREAKNNYFPLIQRTFPEDQWKFLTGKQAQIDRLLHDLGYRLKKTGPHTFIHPTVLIVVSGEGQIIRYLYGNFFLPFDIGMALSEAAKGTPQLSIRRVLSYCFAYDPQKGRYVVSLFRISAAGIILMLGLFLLFLLRKKHPAGEAPKGQERNHD